MSEGDNVYFSVDNLNLCVSASSVHSIHDGLNTQREAGTQSWFLGLAVVEGRLLPVTDLGAFYGKKPSAGRVIEVAHQLGRFGLRVDEVHGVASEMAREYETLDIAQLVQSDQFLDIQSSDHACEPA